MKRMNAWAWSVVLAGVVATTGFAANPQPGAPAGGGGMSVWVGGAGVERDYTTSIYTVMIDAVGLTDEQKPKVKAELDAMNTEQEDLRKDNEDLMLSIKKGTFKMEQAAELQKIQSDMQKSTTAHIAKILALLTPEQRARWEVYKLDCGLQMRLFNVTLSADQTAALKKAEGQIGQEISELKDPNDQAALAAEYGKLWKTVAGSILTEEQLGKALSLYSAGVPMGMFRPARPEPRK